MIEARIERQRFLMCERGGKGQGAAFEESLSLETPISWTYPSEVALVDK